MTAAIKTRLDAIDEQMAALQKEQAKLREELGVPDFVPGWYLAWGVELTDKEYGASIDYCENETDLELVRDSWDNVAPFTPELAARFFPKTRYDWAKIVKDYPEAKWASTDVTGRVDLWEDKPVVADFLGSWGAGASSRLVGGGCVFVGNTPDWRDSLEARPEGI